MDSGTYVWLTSVLFVDDLLVRTEVSEPMTLDQARGWVLAALDQAGGSERLRQAVRTGPQPGETDVTVSVAHPAGDGVMTLAVVGLAGRTPEAAADVWAGQMAAEYRAAGIDAATARRPGTEG